MKLVITRIMALMAALLYIVTAASAAHADEVRLSQDTLCHQRPGEVFYDPKGNSIVLPVETPVEIVSLDGSWASVHAFPLEALDSSGKPYDSYLACWIPSQAVEPMATPLPAKAAAVPVELEAPQDPAVADKPAETPIVMVGGKPITRLPSTGNNPTESGIPVRAVTGLAAALIAIVLACFSLTAFIQGCPERREEVVYRKLRKVVTVIRSIVSWTAVTIQDAKYYYFDRHKAKTQPNKRRFSFRRL